MEYAGERGVQLPVGIEMELMVIKQQQQVTNFTASLGRNLVGNHAIANIGTFDKVRQRSLNF